jgi:hypothetical protein
MNIHLDLLIDVQNMKFSFPIFKTNKLLLINLYL